MLASFELLFSQLPELLRQVGEQHWQKLVATSEELAEKLSQGQLFKAKYCFALSDFVATSCIYKREVFERLFLSDKAPLDHQEMVERVEAFSQIPDEKGYIQAIRVLRKMAMASIAVSDLTKQQSIEQSYTLVSKLCDLLVLNAYQRAYGEVAKVFGKPVADNSEAMPLTILGMGKLGGGELNFSSDIDLIFCYPHSGQTQGGRRVVDNQQFFVKVAQKLIQYLNQNTADGFVFRVDMRLRPFGDSGPLVLSYAAMEDYYQEQGRDWERYAMLKARIIGEQDNPYAQELQTLLRPFVYRRYIDFSVIESLRKMKLLISQEARRKDTGVNIKLGSGGIREVEFVAQALQMIRGGREKQLQVRPLLLALERLTQLKALEQSAYEQLKQSYLELRRCEHYLQQFNDQQTQWLANDELNQLRLVHLFDKNNWNECLGYIEQVMGTVHQQFKLIIADAAEEKTEILSPFEVFWQMPKLSTGAQILAYMNEQQQQEVVERLNLFKADCQKRSIGSRGRIVLDTLIPQLLGEMLLSKEPMLTIERVLNVVAKIASRTAYLELLNENAGALKQLVKLCSQSCWIAEQLSFQPVLLDELIDPRVLYSPIEPHLYYQELESQMIRVPEDDMEQQLETLRHFKLAKQLHIAAADISRVLKVREVSTHLTALAEACMECVINIAWKQMVERYGNPYGRDLQNKGFAVIGYGKLGGTELGYDSDLDVVFVHDCDTVKPTDGAKQIDSRQFYLKLAQRIIHIFTSRTVSGILYDIDCRIRPQGNSGLLACHINTYQAYLIDEAWTWEHQALVRARMVYGNEAFRQSFSDIRQAILQSDRDQQKLKSEVVDMRVKMRDNLAKSAGLMFDLKQGLGGIADIEFITQYLVLAHSKTYPELTSSCVNLRLFELFAKVGIIDKQQAEILSHSYRQLRKIGHRLTLQKQDKLTDNEYAKQLSEDIQAIWQQVF